MTVRVRLFASLADLAGRRELDLSLPDRGTAAALLELVEERVPTLRGKLSGVAVAARAEIVGPGHVLAEGDEIALLPPVSGG
jgi:molybdopterin synthase catalytic subunit